MKGLIRKWLLKARWLLFYLYIVFLSYFLFFSEHYGRENIMKNYRYNLELFREIKRFIIYRQQLGFENFMVNIFGNIFAFAPFGFLLPLLSKKYRKFSSTFFLCFLFSFCVETIQLILKVGIFDVDDIFMNTIGGILGFLGYLICNAIFQRIHLDKKIKNQ